MNPAAESASMNSGIQSENLRAIFNHDLKYWKSIADEVLIWSLGVAGLAAVIVGVSTWLSMKWGDEISDFNERTLAAYKLTVDGKVADAHTAGIEAGAAAASAGQKAHDANVAVAKARERTAELEKEAAQLRLALAEESTRSSAGISDLNRRIGPRILDRTKFKAELSEQPKSIVNIVYTNEDEDDSYSLALQIKSTLLDIGWKVSGITQIDVSKVPRTADRPTAMLALGLIFQAGVGVYVKHFADTDFSDVAELPNVVKHTAYAALYSALLQSGIATVGNEDQSLPEGQLFVLVGPRR